MVHYLTSETGHFKMQYKKKKKDEKSKFPSYPRSSLTRRENIRKTLEVTLTICEGKKDEPGYLKAMRNDLGILPQRVIIESCRSSSPKNIVGEAIKRAQEEEYDRVFCVFDHDEREEAFKEAIKKIKLNEDLDLVAISSIPCFEFWILLHYTYSSKQYKQTQPGQKTVSELLGSQIRKHDPNYHKKMDPRHLYKNTKPFLSTAIQNAKRLEKERIENPSTKMHFLVEYLLGIKP